MTLAKIRIFHFFTIRFIDITRGEVKLESVFEKILKRSLEAPLSWIQLFIVYTIYTGFPMVK